MIRCDYLLQHASKFIRNDLSRFTHASFFLVNCSSGLYKFILEQQEKYPELDSTFLLFTDAVASVVGEGKVRTWYLSHPQLIPTDYYNQAKQMLCHLQKGQDSIVAQFCADHGIGHIFHKNGLEALVLDDSESDGDITLLQISYIQMIARLEKSISLNEETVGIEYDVRT